MLLFVMGIPALYLWNRNIFLEIMKDMRWLRLSHYFIMLVLGCALAVSDTHENVYQVIANNHSFIVKFIFCTISIMFAGIFSIVTNNITDQDIDRISNQARPLVSGKIPLQIYRKIGYASLIMALIYAMAAGMPAFILISLIIVSYYIYSMPPIRFKRVLILSKLAISINSLAMIFLGYVLLGGELQLFPLILFPLLLIGFTLTANVIDIKDYEGDKAGGITTLPGVLGLRLSRLLIGIAFLLTYVSFAFLLNSSYYFFIFFAVGLVQFFLVNKKVYQESQVFMFNLLSLISFIMLLMI